MLEPLLRELRRATSAVAPPRCAVCEGGCESAELVCAACAAAIAAEPTRAPGPPGVELAVAAGPYAGVVRELAHALKFGRRVALAAVAADAILAACRREEPEFAESGVLVPVPPARHRRAWRGFDPAEEIALALAARSGMALRRCLRRRAGPRQVGRPREQRLGDPPRIAARGRAPQWAVLVDDVHTTGATLSACAAALRAAGSVRVTALTFARSR
ncbi:MAG: ComF family protein [Solirubrobacterales bacterium]